MFVGDILCVVPSLSSAGLVVGVGRAHSSDPAGGQSVQPPCGENRDAESLFQFVADSAWHTKGEAGGWA